VIAEDHGVGACEVDVPDKFSDVSALVYVQYKVSALVYVLYKVSALVYVLYKVTI